nr:histidine phosphatase family protein [Bacillus ectoiniformans]
MIRHGKSIHKEGNRMNSKQFQKWVMAYDQKGIESADCFPEQTKEAVKKAEAVVTSHLKRSIDSASSISHQAKVVTDQLYREVDLPELNLPSIIKLKPSAWLVLSRIIWLAGFSHQAESYKEAKIRARQAAKQLSALTQHHRQIVLFGHGFFNRMIASELQSIGWRGRRRPRAKHWHAATYKRIDS